MYTPENSLVDATEVKMPEQQPSLSEVAQDLENPQKPAEAKHSSKFHKRIQTAKRALQTAVIAAEVNHVTNEGVRFGSFAATMAETHNPMLGGVVLGGTTLVIEGAGALATANLLSADQRGWLLDWALNKGKKIVPKGTKIPPAGEFGAAMIAGTPVLMGLKNLADPERTLKQNRRHGLFTASWLASLFTAEGAILGNSVEKYNDPKMLAAGAVAVGGLAMAVKFSKSLIKNNSANKGSGKSEQADKPEGKKNQPQVLEGQELTEEQIENSANFYSNFRNDNDQGVRIGLFAEDLDKALRSSGSILFNYQESAGNSYFVPLLVPIQELEWYNTELLEKLYGEDTDLYYYTHPPLPGDPAALNEVAEMIKERLDNGAVLVTDRYESIDDGLLAKVASASSGQYELAGINVGDMQRRVDIFAGLVNFGGVSDIKNAPPILQIYKVAVDQGEYEP
ncbi:hypothetical protein HY379_01780, partial [Candidatus Saccharibacteria bacterium]|nr:hypothetical protein [Candidatus Saccharibacteria bacterium]